MKIMWRDENFLYDGSQLKPLKNYLNYELLGDSIVAWQGPCKVSLDHMMDGEDLLARSKIESDQMLHFVLELFNYPLSAAIGLQRLMGEMLIQSIKDHGDTQKAQLISRRGDDLYWDHKKLNVSIATCSTTSSLIHFGINVGNKGTPVPTCSLEDFAIQDVAKLAQSFMEKLREEFLHQKRAALKVRSF